MSCHGAPAGWTHGGLGEGRLQVVVKVVTVAEMWLRARFNRHTPRPALSTPPPARAVG